MGREREREMARVCVCVCTRRAQRTTSGVGLCFLPYKKQDLIAPVLAAPCRLADWKAHRVSPLCPHLSGSTGVTLPHPASWGFKLRPSHGAASVSPTEPSTGPSSQF